MQGLREMWADGQHTLGAWLAIPTAFTAEATARTGFDYVCIDTQHGAIEYSDAVGMIQGVLLGASCPIVRVPWNEPGIIGKMLDAGAHGVIVPMVNNADQARAAVSACRYAPLGSRSWGPTVTAMRHDNYRDWSGDHVAVIPMIETVEAVANLPEILAVPGIDAIYVGPADLSLTLGLAPRANDDEPAFDAALDTIVTACAAAGVVAGIHGTGAITPRRLAAGFRMITVATDVLAMKAGLVSELDIANGMPAAGDAGATTLY